MQRGAERITALSHAAHALGLSAGQSVTDARALVPNLVVYPSDPEQDDLALTALARWLVRYSPLTALDPPPAEAQDQTPGILIDATGCDHFFGSLTAMCRDIQNRLRAQGIDAQLAVAPTKLGARALARHRPGTVARDLETLSAALKPVPVMALRLDQTTTARLNRLGLTRIGDITDLPRTSLARRFGGQSTRRSSKAVSDLLEHLDKATGRIGDPVMPLLPVPDWRITRRFADPLQDQVQLLESVRAGLDDLMTQVKGAQEAIRQVSLDLMAVDGGHSRKTLRPGIATVDVEHLMRLFTETLKDIELGFGLDALTLSADVRENRRPKNQSHAAIVADPETERADRAAELGALLDRLTVRLGQSAVHQMAYEPGHVPERQQKPVPAQSQPLNWEAARTSALSRAPRPLKLLTRPEAVDVLAALPEGLPLQFRWRRVLHRLNRAEGPERIASQWWANDMDQTRDYYRVETRSGARFWLFRYGLYPIPGVRPGGGSDPRWFLHGLFA